MSKSEALYQKELEKRFEKSLRLMEYKYMSTKYKQDKKHRGLGGVDIEWWLR